jgi:hypothetical protein
MPELSAWDERVRVCGIPSRRTGLPAGLPGVVRERNWFNGEPGIGKIALLSPRC